ncbi:hypothetical protein EU642_21890 [Salmonella enterica]|nr:hypothetical protein [Salmonella enterica]EAO0118506.1 hypothetical protein [Salmonella enterica]EAO3601611.1 hypothetical protein [Salmonella enterica]EAR6391504.1 hypothetical protein [Salmonella enterica]EAV1285268.1 hypothetical protein [Salmonella enterica]
MNIPKFTPEDAGEFLKSSELSQSDAKEWVVIHSFLVDEDERRCCVSPPMLAMKWEMAETVFNSLLEEGLMNVARNNEGDAYMCRMTDEKDAYRIGIFSRYGTEEVPKEVLALLDRRALTDELYYELYLRDGVGETTVHEMTIVPPAAPTKPVLH